jgi:acyl transferase domain-containing protein
LSDAQPDRAFFFNTLGSLWLAGIEPNWNDVNRHQSRSRIPLPTYPFERQRYWRKSSKGPEQKYAAGPAMSQPVAAPAAREIVSPGVVDQSAAWQNGDRGNSRPHLGAEYVAPANSTEQRIAEIWEELLGIHPIGVHDEFLRLGGNSLLAIRVAAELREAFQIDFPLAALLKSSTVAEIALLVEDALLTMIEGMDEAEVSRMENT